MKNSLFRLTAASLLIGLAAGCARKSTPLWQTIRDPAVTAQLKSFVAEKRAQADAATNAAPDGYAAYFAAAERGDWQSVSNLFGNFRKHAGQYEHTGKTDERLRGTKWQAIIEIWGTLDAFGEGDPKYSAAFANDIIHSIPPGSIYFGGTDPGRFLVTGMEKSQVNGDPFFLVTQNALADSTYLDYVRGMYGDRIYIPTADDVAKCFTNYTADAEKRMKIHQLRPGEDIKLDADGRVQVSGTVAVMEINGLLTKIIFDENTNREFYVEESFPIDWMYPRLEPHGLIMKLNRQPLEKIPDDVVGQDREYWQRYLDPMIGGWLDQDTSVSDVAAFAQRVFVKKDLSGFTGDREFLANEYPQKMFSKLRASQAGIYAWRAQQARDPAERKRMNDAADFAFRQAIALCPYSPEAVFRYVNLLISQKRFTDALAIAQSAAATPQMQGPDGSNVRALVAQLKTMAR